eukprot:TRINITY_DN2842_c0_g1_i4.p1 TRINITY_DN2842_c0_g1~~TRINITY_DN2842_c0_g1_i4.p1  ORF type:complete len:874 (+),score=145.79 TRINITY_DN2842_c0_g1_i4:61-2622(+)
MGLGVQSLTLALAVSMIFATGLVLGGISISTGKTSTDDAWATGDRGIAQCMDSGSINVKGITARLLESVLSEFGTQVHDMLSFPLTVTRGISKFLRLFHPDVTSDPTFIDTDLRAFLYTYHQSAIAKYPGTGIGVVLWNETTNSDTLRYNYDNNGRGAWGGEVFFFVDNNVGTGMVEARASHPYGPMTLEEGVISHYGTSNSSGRIIQGPCDYITGTGSCPLDLWATMQPQRRNNLNKCFLNMKTSDGPLVDVGDPTISEIMSSGPSISIQTCLAISHPAQINRYPRQNFRTGWVTLSVSPQTISEKMRAAILPEGSILYAAERHPSSGKVETLGGANVGKPFFQVSQFDENGNEIWRLGIPYPLVNHTLNGEAFGPLSPVARFSRYMNGIGDNHYEYLSQQPSDSILDWTDPDTSILYWVRVTPVTLFHLTWYLTFLVPRESVMSVIDEASEAIRETIRKDKKSADDKSKKSHLIMYVVTSVCVLLLLLISYLFTTIIISPLIMLGDDMAAVAVMETEAVDLTGPLSGLVEVREMQSSFRVMVKNLIEFKSYMPQSVLIKSSDEETEEGPKSSGRSKASGTGSMRSSNNSRSLRSQARYAQCSDFGLKRKNVSVIMFNCVGWHNDQPDSTEAIMSKHSSLIENLTTSVAQNKGICDAFSGDRMMAYFNANKNNAGHRLSVVKSGLGAYELSKLKISFAATTGDCMVGNIGVTGMKKYSILSPIVPFAACLEKLSSIKGCKGLIDSRCADACRSSIDCRATALVTFSKVSKGKQQLVFEPLTLTEEDGEWMHDLEASGKHKDWNEYVHCIVAGDFNEAKKHVASLDKYTGCKTYTLWKGACSANEQPAVIALA